MKKIPLILLSALLMTGCTSGPDMTSATQQPTSTQAPTNSPMTSPDAIPEVTGVLPGVINDMEDATGMDMTPSATETPESTGVTSMDKARRVIEQIEDELEKLSEVDDAQVIIAGHKAAVALEFDDQYRSGVDERLRGIVKDRIGSIISGVTTIAVTADQDIMDAIESLGDRLDTVSDMNALESDLDAIIRKINSVQA